MGKPVFKIWIAALSILLLAAVACGEGSFEPGPLGAVEVAEGERIQIRSLEWYNVGEPSGDRSGDHSEIERATRLAIADYGPIKGRAVDLGEGLDDMCSADGGLAGAQTITSDPKVVGVIGTSCSVAAAAAMPLISEAGMVMISGANDAPALTSDLEGNPGENFHKGYYRVSHNGLHASETVAAFLRDQGYDRAAVIHQDDLVMTALARNFADFFEIFGGEVTNIIQIDPARTAPENLDPLLDEIVAAGAQAVFVPVFARPGQAVVEAAHHHAGTEDIPLVLQTLTRQFRGMAESQGVYFTNPDRDFDSHTNDHTGRDGHDILEEYVDTFGETLTANRFWPGGYDATTMLLSAIEETAVERDGSLWIDRQALRDALDATDFNGVTGRVKCDAFGDCGHGLINVLHHEEPDDFEGTHDKIVFRFEPL